MKYAMQSVVLIVLVLGLGCQTSQRNATLVDIQRRMAKIDKSMNDSLVKLNETTAALSARVENSDQQTRQLRSMVEDNLLKMKELQKDIRALQSAASRAQSAVPSLPPNVEAGQGGVTVEDRNAPSTAPGAPRQLPPLQPLPPLSPNR